ncbi:hypothetical protein EDD37DRAFT_670432 [Exophiala viscosa]|uniref:uncharacterized protein n=1 Tax=Exophiala viscosa TaxID=2486360 RepID=UPI002192EBA7|nr:hypothetical protein EDD37DRAFT_670432 [Exophiala viscosa]
MANSFCKFFCGAGKSGMAAQERGVEVVLCIKWDSDEDWGSTIDTVKAVINNDATYKDRAFDLVPTIPTFRTCRGPLPEQCWVSSSTSSVGAIWSPLQKLQTSRQRIKKRARPEVIDLDNGDRASYTPDPDPNSAVAGEVALEDESGMVAAFDLRRADQPRFFTKKDAVTFFRNMANAIASGSSVPSSVSFHTYRSPEVQYGRPSSVERTVERQDTPTRGPSHRPRPGSQTYPPITQAPFATPVMGSLEAQAGPAPTQSRPSQQSRHAIQQQSSGRQPDVYSQSSRNAGLGISTQRNQPAVASPQGPNVPGLRR